MSNRVFLVTLSVEIPVVADSEEEAREFLLEENCDVIEKAAQQMKADLISDEDEAFHVMEITEEMLDDEYSDYEDLVPWGDDSNDTVGQRLREQDAYSDEEEFGWGEPAHVED